MRSLHTPAYQAFVAIMVEARKKTKISQHELARRLGKPQSFVSKYERCERRLDVAEFVKVAHALEIDPSKLMRRIDKALS